VSPDFVADFAAVCFGAGAGVCPEREIAASDTIADTPATELSNTKCLRRIEDLPNLSLARV
jgi:hypothetical protein